MADHLGSDFDQLFPGGLRPVWQGILSGKSENKGAAVFAIFQKDEFITAAPESVVQVDVVVKLTDGRHFQASNTVNLFGRPAGHSRQNNSPRR